MNVRVTLTFDETMRRKIRAHDKRGGKATRKEAMVFTVLAVRALLDRCPEPRRRRPRVKVVEQRAGLTVAPAETPADLKAVRAKIARAFGHKVGA